MSNPTKRPEVVVITGASAGVGRATVREFARRGAHVALVARGLARSRTAAARDVVVLHNSDAGAWGHFALPPGGAWTVAVGEIGKDTETPGRTATGTYALRPGASVILTRAAP